MLQRAILDYTARGRSRKPDNPFAAQAPQFFSYLGEEKGLRPGSVDRYRFYLRHFAAYLGRIEVEDLAALSPSMLSGFVADYSPGLAWTTLRDACGSLRVFLRYLHREGVTPRDLSALVEFPPSYRLSGIPRAIGREEVEQVLAGVDRRSPNGKRDFAILLLLATYGLRACEVATLTLDDIDWRNDRLKIRSGVPAFRRCGCGRGGLPEERSSG